jgi:hypothetical protein
MDERRFVTVAAGWTFVTTVLVTAVAGAVPGGLLPVGLILGSADRFVPQASDWAARLAALLGTGFYVTMFAISVALPVGVAVVRRRAGDDSAVTTGLLVGGLAAFPGLPLLLLVSDWPGVGAYAAIATVSLLAVVVRSRHADDSMRSVVAPPFAHAVLVVVLLLGLVTGNLVAWTATTTVVESEQIGVPQVAFDANYTETDDGHAVVTITHEGGETVLADRLDLVSDEFATVSGVDQTSPGPWQGSVSGEGQVASGDSVTVGVERDCTVRVVYEYAGVKNTIGIARCAELR